MKPPVHGVKGGPSIVRLAEAAGVNEGELRATIHQLFAMLEADVIELHNGEREGFLSGHTQTELFSPAPLTPKEGRR